MSETSPSPQRETGSGKLPEQEKIETYKGWIEGMIRVLKPPADIGDVEAEDVEQYKKQLLDIVAEVGAMKTRVSMNGFFSSTDNFLEKIQDGALVEMLVALKKLDKGEDHEYFRCLLKCPKHLEEALALFLI